jgi:hypothetical protein
VELPGGTLDPLALPRGEQLAVERNHQGDAAGTGGRP